jgi:uncharacterized membrane protein YjjP (DUF1212 family)
MMLTDYDIKILLEQLSKKIMADKEALEDLQKKCDELCDIPQLYDDWLENQNKK